MKTDSELKKDVQDELSWEPSIDETKIGVAVENGIVTLSGEIDSYGTKLATEKAAKRVYGVRAVVENITVKHPSGFSKSDVDIAKSVLNALKWHSAIPVETIMVKVEKGWVYLTGEVKWAFQRDSAAKAIMNLSGIKGISNNISIKHDVEPVEVSKRIKDAFERSAEIDAKRIIVAVNGHTVTLSGKVKSIKEKEEAQHAAFNAPGVFSVQNNLQVEFSPIYA